MFIYPDPNAGHCLTGTTCFVVFSKKRYMADGIPHYIKPIKSGGFSHRYSHIDNLNYWDSRAFCRSVITCIGMDEKKGERKIIESLEPNFGKCNVGNTPFRFWRDGFFTRIFRNQQTGRSHESGLIS